ncbi:MAG: CHRD domain-containing protein, partial [Pirellulaceae bacterium]|nr:CHRD domain-containing protein [Pirellulaceae bacterium]
FSQTGPLMVTLSSSLSFNSSGINGGVNDDFFINSSDMQAILDGRTYINVHTDAFEFGEIRGYLVAAVPEPGTTGLVLAGAIFVGLRRRRHR